MVKVTLDKITKKFGETIAIDNLSLEVKEGEFFILLGPSGCGKSTTLNIIAGLEEPTSGHVYFDDEIVDHLPPEKRDVAMVFQSYALYPHMTAYDNIAFSLKIKKVPKEEIKKRVNEVAELLRIHHLLNRKPYELSGGERQRVALARAIIRKPKAFLLDEPMSNIDAKLRVAMRGELIRLQKMLKTTTIYVTHDQVEAMTMGDRVAVLDKGKLMQVGSPLEIFERPANVFVAGFLGSPSMNFFDCTLQEREKEGKAFLETSYFSIEVSKDLAETIKTKASGSELMIGARPQHVLVSKKPVKGGIECEVYAVEPLGTETIVDLKVGDEVVRAVTGTIFEAQIGEKVWMNFDVNKLHIFDKRTEQCIV